MYLIIMTIVQYQSVLAALDDGYTRFTTTLTVSKTCFDTNCLCSCTTFEVTPLISCLVVIGAVEPLLNSSASQRISSKYMYFPSFPLPTGMCSYQGTMELLGAATSRRYQGLSLRVFNKKMRGGQIWLIA